MVNKKHSIYVMSTYSDKGGARSLHQLVKSLAESGFNAYIYYFDQNKTECACADMRISVAGSIDDEHDNFLIIPESFIYKSIKYQKIKKVIWWLSFYYYIKQNPIYDAEFMLKRKGLQRFLYLLYSPYHLIKNFSYFKNNYTNKRFKQIDAALGQYLHLYNCEYARQYLESKSIPEQNMHYLCGPLTGEFEKNPLNECLNAKKNVIAINPVKVDKRILKKFKEALKPYQDTIELVEIKGMTPAQVNEALLKTKVYVDLGYFPGPERMPREAVMAYCAVFTSTVGAAENDIDVPISRNYKCDLQKGKMSDIVARIVEMVDNYESIVHDFDTYRDKVVDQIERFDGDVKKIFTEIVGNETEDDGK